MVLVIAIYLTTKISWEVTKFIFSSTKRILKLGHNIKPAI